MRRTLPILVLAALVLAACGEAGGGAGTVAQSTGGGMEPGISVSGTGEVKGRPDTLIVDIGVAVLRPSVDEATSDAARLAQAVIDALKANGVAEEDIATTNYSIWPEYDYRNETQTLRGYRVQNVVSASIRDLDNAGTAIDAATAAGGNDTIVQGVRFAIEEDSELVTAARAAAWADAKTKAEQLAGLAGRSLGAAISISESTTFPTPVPFYARAAEGAGDVATPIEPGQQTVTVTISVQFALEG